MISRLYIIVVILFSVISSAKAQGASDFAKFKARQTREFNKFRDAERKKFEEFRRKRNEEYAAFMRKKWEAIESKGSIAKPIEKRIEPVVWNEDDKKQTTPRVLPIDKVVVTPKPKPRPEPIAPVLEIPINIPVSKTVEFAYFGTPGKVRFDRSKLVKLKAMDENTVADAWLAMSDDAYTNLLHDCLKIREEKNLCDWAYLMMLQGMADAVCGGRNNDAVLLMAYLYCQSGYKMRLGHSGGRLYMLYASEHIIYGQAYYDMDGSHFYVLNKKSGSMNICKRKFPQEKPLSLLISGNQGFSFVEESPVKHQSKHYADMDINVGVNKNLLAFYNSYPSSKVGSNFVSRWAMYANAPMAENVVKQIYPKLKSSIADCDQLTAVNKLLNLVQTGFVYEYDDKVWGDDRAFFAEETLHYPYSDCEDRSILFSRLVRDLLGLDVILVYYPGHLATAVEFSENVDGDCLMLGSRKFIVCDPTYVGAPVGQTMPNMDNGNATVMLLD